ncbi:MAG: hypothetical protein HQK76_07460 [Desulfobacterales bacterium]|nr:hypothetical protein [Desulfobacterales bacterium]
MNQFEVSQNLINWIKATTGIHIVRENYDMIKIAIKECAKNKMMDPNNYESMLLSNQINPQDIIDQIVTTETFFLRHENTMQSIIQNIIPDLLSKKIKPMILSIGCARGEEPYSFAMLLLDLGIDPELTTIIGIDISKENITHAKQGIYSLNSMRRVPKDFLNKHFSQIANKNFKINSYINNSVIFKRMNFLTEAVNYLNYGFHIIFCHNVFIYFDKATIIKSLNIIDKLLDNDGWFFVDNSEGPNLKGYFERIKVGNSYGFKKKQKPLIIKTEQKKDSDKKLIIPNKKIKEKINKYKRDTASEILAKAKEAYRTKSFDKALKFYQNLIDLFPSFRSIGLLGIAKIYADQDNSFQALETAELALQENETNAGKPLTIEDLSDAYIIIALILKKKGISQSAGLYFNKLKEINPTHQVLKVYYEK